ncbi:hypothetical protein SDRG_08188 [Saprolegnia diclina VS20]|uniref:Transmembrane protein n=1 Tax=Saprolegnia diclina (strain VS20) TaxID=1156394 RepID=T0RPI5_SAPDV|nr:hypothetical protein SDRG_08188 [Saprolegnia diclina VS20]EQC34418.1 hypothetical protein SDRG_08188 [Saprolegnia diclina VS20]|eukprot:XP_008612280.1 hypothetical protein SDRG_08188 [Saprolegnia diclina VS20]
MQPSAKSNDGIWLYDDTLYAETLTAYPSRGHDSYEFYPHKISETDDPNGALRPGGALDLTSAEAIGLLGQYVAVGVIYGFLPALAYPVYTQYLNFSGYQVASYTTLVSISWSLKIFFGVLTDCFPLFGLKRKPYMIIGWLLCIAALCGLAFRPFPDPYLPRALAANLTDDVIPRVRGGDFSDLSEAQVAMLHMSAKSEALYYILLSSIASFGYVLADVAADAMVVQYAQREPIATRGKLQSAIYGTRYAASLLPSLITGFCLNGHEFGGSFDWALSINVLYGIMLLPCAFAILCVIFLVQEDREFRPMLRYYVSTLWRLLTLRVTWQICAFRFLSNFCYNFYATAAAIIPMQWAHVEPLVSAGFDVLNTLLMSACIFAVGRWGVNMNWRRAIAIATIAEVVIDGSVMLCTTWDVVRNQFFFMGVTTPDTIPGAVRFVISAFCAVEIADVGNEGAVHSLITSIVNLSDPVATMVYKYVDSFFDTEADDLATDTNHVRWQVTYTFLIAYGMQLASLAFLPLLPHQKAAVQWLKKRGGTHASAAVIIVVCYVAALVFSVTTNIMSLYSATSCLRIAGGDGKPVRDAMNRTICG